MSLYFDDIYPDSWSDEDWGGPRVPKEYIRDGVFMLDEWLADTSEREAEGFHDFIDSQGYYYDHFEVFYADADMAQELTEEWEGEYSEGWYWWTRFPVSRPDSAPVGPFPSAKAAYRDALEASW